MKQKKSLILLTSIIIFSGVTQAALFDRGKGMIYDDQLNITWLQDANYAKTSGYAAENLVENHEGDPIIIREDGRMSWTSANQWADNLVYEGYDDWRLPTLRTDLNFSRTYFEYQSETIYYPGHYIASPLPPFYEDSVPELAIGYYTVDDLNNELSFMFYQNLRNTSGIGEVFGAHGFHRSEPLCTDGNCLTNTGSFINVDNIGRGFWTNLLAGDGGGVLFDIHEGKIATDTVHNTYSAWAVRSGDVSQVPIPSTILLFGSGLLGLLGLKKRK